MREAGGPLGWGAGSCCFGPEGVLSSAPPCQSWPHAGAVPSSGSGPAPHLLDSWKSDASTLTPGSRAASRLPWSALGQAAARALIGACALGAGGQRSYRPSCPVSRLPSRLTPELPGGQAAPPHSLRQVQFRSAEQSGLDALRPRPRCRDLGQGGARRGTLTPPRTAADPALPRGPRAWGTSGAAGSGGWSGPCDRTPSPAPAGTPIHPRKRGSKDSRFTSGLGRSRHPICHPAVSARP